MMTHAWSSYRTMRMCSQHVATDSEESEACDRRSAQRERRKQPTRKHFIPNKWTYITALNVFCSLVMRCAYHGQDRRSLPSYNTLYFSSLKTTRYIVTFGCYYSRCKHSYSVEHRIARSYRSNHSEAEKHWIVYNFGAVWQCGSISPFFCGSSSAVVRRSIRRHNTISIVAVLSLIIQPLSEINSQRVCSGAY